MLPYNRFSNFHFDIQEFSNIVKCFFISYRTPNKTSD